MIMLVFEDAPNKGLQAPKIVMLGTEIGHMEAGKKKTVSVNFPPLNSPYPLRWVALVFSGGTEVRATMGNQVLDQLFNIVDHIGLNNVIVQRSSGDYPLMVYRRFPLKFGDDLKKKYSGKR